MKLPFALVALEVEKVYSSIIQESQLDTQCRVISTYLEACGWDETEFWERFMQESETIACGISC